MLWFFDAFSECKDDIRPHPGLSPRRGGIVYHDFEIFPTGLVGRSSSNPETSESYFLSWGRGQKVRAGVSTHSTENFKAVFFFNLSVFSVSSCSQYR